jgi:phosphoserine phosphatase
MPSTRMNSENPILKFSSRADFTQAVLQLNPQLAVFDCDGTLWAGDAGFGFFDWELTRGLLSDDVVRWARARYHEYLAGRVSEDDMCAEMVTINRGLPVADVMRAAGEFFEEKMLDGFFPEMKDLVFRLHDSGSEVWAVSSTSEWVIQAGMKHFGIPASRVLAAAVVVEDGRVTDKVIRVPSGIGKPQAIREVIARTPDAVFGNSIWDADMLEIARHPFVISPTPELLIISGQRKWPVYYPEPVSSF